MRGRLARAGQACACGAGLRVRGRLACSRDDGGRAQLGGADESGEGNVCVRLAVGVGRVEQHNQPLHKVALGEPLKLVG